MRQQMAGDAFLYLGGAETVIGVSDVFKTVQGQRGVYTVADTVAPAAPAAVPVATPIAKTA